MGYKRILTLAIVAIALSTAWSASAYAAGNEVSTTGKTYTLKVADWFPKSDPISKEGIQYWMEQVRRLTSGRVSFKYFPAGQLGKASTLLQITQNGLVDIAIIAPGYNADKMPLSTVGGLPGLFSNACVGSRAIWEISKPGSILYKDSFKALRIRPLFLAATPQYEILSNKEIQSPADVKGLKVRSSGNIRTLAIKAIGGVPVNVATAEMYQAIKLGTIDAIAFPPSNALAYSLEEVVQYVTKGASLGAFVDMYAISEQAWKRLPSDIQDAFVKAGRLTNKHLCQALMAGNKKALETFEANAVSVTRVTDEDEWKSALAMVSDEWVDRMEQRGLDDAARVLSKLQAALDEQRQSRDK